jgi:RND family efflux transporter MFP subunit
MKRKYILVVLLIGLVLTGCGKKEEAAKPVLKPVVTEKLTPQKAINTQSFSGIIDAFQNIEVPMQSPGVVKKVYVDIGARISKGQLLAQIDDTTYRANYERADAAYRLAKLSKERQEALFKEGVISQQQMDTIEAGYKEAYAAYLVAKKQLNDCAIRSPIYGTVAVKNIDEGEMPDTKIPAFVVINDTKMEIPLAVTEKYVVKIKKGARATITVDALPEKKFIGYVLAVGMLADSATGAFPVKISVPNPTGLLKAGMVAKVELIVDYTPNGKVVALDSVVSKEEQKGLMLLDEKNMVARFRPIEVLYEFGDKALITGIDFGKSVIVVGQKNIVDGEKVATTNRVSLNVEESL